MFWDNFYHLCELRNTTPNAVCKELNLSTATATHWKNGTMPKGDVLFNLANLLDCSVDYLLGRTDNKNGYSNNNINNSDNFAFGENAQVGTCVDGMEKEMIDEFKKLTFNDKVKVINLIAELNQKGA